MTEKNQPKIILKLNRLLILILLLPLVPLVFSTACRKKADIRQYPQDSKILDHLKTTGYAIQVGAYSKVENALNMTEALRKQGIEAYYFRHESGLYKVRFGEFSMKTGAKREAMKLVEGNIIPEFFIINPSITSQATPSISSRTAVRNNLVETAINYHGLPYCWGGTSPDIGFDCSGLAVAVYRLNGFSLPRTCLEQYVSGIPVSKTNLLPGDLVFFETTKTQKASHVGIYIGGGKFIHATAQNKKIRTDSLNHSYYRKRYLGARRFVYQPE